MTNDRDIETKTSDSIWFRFRDYGIGRSGYYPVVSLPEQKAESASDWLRIIEVLAIVLFVASALLFVFGQVGVNWAPSVAVAVIILRAGTLLVNYAVIVKPVEKVQTTDEVPDLSSEGKATVFDDIELRVGVQNQQIKMRFINNSIHDVSLQASISSPENCIDITEQTIGFELPTRYSDERVVHNIKSRKILEIDFDITESIVTTNHDLVIVDVSGTRINKDLEKVEQIDTKRIRIPIEVRNAEDIVSRTEEYEVVRNS